MTSRILIVEDNMLSQKLRSVVLRSAGYSTEAAHDAREATRSIRQHAPDLIVMDIGLPGKDGYALTRELKADPVTAQIPILVITSYAMKSDRVRAYEAGCDGFLTKPVDRLAFLANVRALLDRADRGILPAFGGTAS